MIHKNNMTAIPDESNDTVLFKAAVYLNNLGVSLMRRGCFRPAMKTFTEAIAVAKLCSCSKHIEIGQLAHPTSFERHDSVDIRKVLDKAYHRLSHSKPPLMIGIELEVISDDENPGGIQSRCLAEAAPTSIKLCVGNFVINTDHLDTEKPNEQDMMIECSIIFYNHGMAYLCLFSLSSSSPFANELYVSAFRMFHLAFLTLTSDHLKKEELPPHQMNRLFIITLFVFRSLIIFSSALGLTKERDEYLHRLVHLKHCIHAFCRDQPAISSPAARAA